MSDVAFLLLLWLLLGWLVPRTRPGPRPVACSLIVFGAAGFALAIALADGFASLRLLDYLAFLHLPVALLVLGRWRLDPGAWRLAVGALAPLGLVACGIWAHWIEPQLLQVNEVTLRSPKLTQPLRIAVVADLQTDRIGSHERRAVRQLMAREPDLILLTGDYLQAPAADLPRLAGELRALLEQEGLAAPLGIYAVRGDVERDAWAEHFAGLPITTVEETTTFETGELTLTALSARDSRRGTTLPASDRFHIVFGHAPDYALGDLDADLQIAGHTHGGQVRLPFLGPILTLSRVPRTWAAGITDLGRGRTLIVSRGIGMERGAAPRLRFLCRPEIVVADVVPGGDRPEPGAWP